MKFPLDDDILKAYYLSGSRVTPLLPEGSSSLPLPSTLVVSPGRYQIHGESYDLREEGLYRFLRLGRENRQCIVYEKDRAAFLSAICWLSTHGTRDQFLAYEQTELLAMSGKLLHVCCRNVDFSAELLQRHHIPARRVEARTLADPNGYNDGHVLIEVKINNRWAVFDLDRGKTYRHQGESLNLLDLIRHTRSLSYQEEAICRSISLAVGNFNRGGYDYDLWWETVHASEDFERELFLRPMGVPIITVPEEERGFFTAFSEEERQRAENLWVGGNSGNLSYLSPDEFRSRFYPDCKPNHS